MSQREVTPLASLGLELGESPIWHPLEGRLYCVDIEGKSIWRFDPERLQAQEYPLDIKVGCLGLRSQGGFIVAGEYGLAIFDQATGELTPITDPEADRPNARFNDGAVGPSGHFWAGTMSTNNFESKLYRLDPDHKLQTMETGIGISNGIGWSPDRSTMYFTDSPRKVIYAYEYDQEAGEIANRRVWVDSSEETGVPDGLCVDQEGCVWSARWDGWRISCYDPLGQLMQEIPMLVQRPTSCTFGGSDLKTLFITSAWTGLTQTERRQQPMAGDLFFVEGDTPGQETNLFLG